MPDDLRPCGAVCMTVCGKPCGCTCGLCVACSGSWEFLGDGGKLSRLLVPYCVALCGCICSCMWMQATEGFRGAYVAAAGLVACATVSLRLFLNLVSVALGVRPVCPVFSIPPHPCICWLHASLVTSCEAAMCGRMVASTHGLVCP